jgi:outer membrane protein assembly factor BamB/tetratricopeptide (TPR) repeat protein
MGDRACAPVRHIFAGFMSRGPFDFELGNIIMRRLALISAFLFGALWVPCVLAQDPPAREVDEYDPSIYVEEEAALKKVLKQAAAAESAQDWISALELYTKALKQWPANVCRTGKGTFTSVGEYVMRKIAAFPPEGRVQYRNTFDRLAAGYWKQALEEGDVGALQRIVDQYFFTSCADDAAFCLAGVHMERGDFHEAMYLLDRVVKYHPDTDLPMQDILFRLALCQKKIGDSQGFAATVKKLADLPQDLKVAIGNARVDLKPVLGVMERVGGIAAPVVEGPDWPVIGGNNSHTRLPSWQSSNDIRRASFPPFRTARKTAGDDARYYGQVQPKVIVYPTACGNALYVSDGRKVFAFDMSNFKILWKTGAASGKASGEDFRPIQFSGANFIFGCTVADGIVFANLHKGETSQRGESAESGCIVAIDAANGKRLWISEKARDEKMSALLQTTLFQSPPIVVGTRVYAAGTSRQGQSREAYLWCFDARTGRPVWKCFICGDLAGNVNPWSGQLMTGNGPTIAEEGGVVYCLTNFGGMAAVDANKGTLLWLTDYMTGINVERTQPQWRGPVVDAGGTWDMWVPVVSGGYIHCTPSDATKRYMVFDTKSGERLSNEQLDARQYVLGISGETTVLCGEKLSFINKDPKNRKRMKESVDLKGSEGVAFMTQNHVYVSMKDQFKRVKLANLKLDKEAKWHGGPSIGEAGTIVVVGDMLVVASETGVSVYWDGERFAREFNEKVAAGDVSAIMEKAASLKENSRYEESIADYGTALRLVREKKDPALADREKYCVESLLWLHKKVADESFQKKVCEKSLEHYLKGLEFATTEKSNSELLIGAGASCVELKRWVEAVGAYQKVVLTCRKELFAPSPGLRLLACFHAANCIDEIIRKQGREAYEAVEKEAQAAYAAACQTGAVEALQGFLLMYPNSVSALQAAEKVAALRLDRGDLQGYMHMLRFLVRNGTADKVAQFRADLCNGYRRMGDVERTRAQANRLKWSFASAEVKDGSSKKPVADFVAERMEWAAEKNDGASKETVRLAMPLKPQKEFVAEGGAANAPEIVDLSGSRGVASFTECILMNRGAAMQCLPWPKLEPAWSWVNERDVLGMRLDCNPPGDDGKASSGVVVGEILSGCAPEKAGLKAKDVIVAVDGKPVSCREEFFAAAAARKGQEIVLTLLKGQVQAEYRYTVPAKGASLGDPVLCASFTSSGRLLLVRAHQAVLVDPVTGKCAWSFPEPGRTATLIRGLAGEGRVFVIGSAGLNSGGTQETGSNGTIVCLDEMTGARLWERDDSLAPALASVVGKVAVSRDNVIVRPCQATVLLIDGETGAKLVEIQASPASLSVPNRDVSESDVAGVAAAACNGDTLFTVLGGRELKAYSMYERKDLWRSGIGVSRGNGCVWVCGEYVCATSDPSKLFVYGVESGKRVLEISLPAGKPLDPGFGCVVEGSDVYVGTADQAGFQIFAYNINTAGKLSWFGACDASCKIARGDSAPGLKDHVIVRATTRVQGKTAAVVWNKKSGKNVYQFNDVKGEKFEIAVLNGCMCITTDKGVTIYGD